jgi:hypothetical protein
MLIMPRKPVRRKYAVKNVLDWLLEENQPSIRYHTLTHLFDKPESNPDVRSSGAMIPKNGWAADLLRKQAPDGSWVSNKSLYRPKYISTNWVLLILADLGLTRKEPRIEKACRLWIERFSKPDGGFGTDNAKKSELCIVGNTTRALVKFGYADHPKVRSAFEWLVREQKENGGWHCWGKNGVLDAWEGMSAFAAYPKQKWTKSIKRAVENGAEFFLERELYKEGKRYSPWFRFHYAIHYYYDLLVGLDFLTALGFASDRRLTYAADLLREKRRHDGRWNLDAIHPEMLRSSNSNLHKKHPRIPLALEQAGKPSKMITLTALKVLKLMGESPATRHL